MKNTNLSSMISVLFLLILITTVFSLPLISRDLNQSNVRRKARQLDFSFGAEHETNQGTDIFAELKAQLWESENKKTQVEGSATYNQHFGGFGGDGNPKIGGVIRVHHDYK